MLRVSGRAIGSNGYVNVIPQLPVCHFGLDVLLRSFSPGRRFPPGNPVHLRKHAVIGSEKTSSYGMRSMATPTPAGGCIRPPPKKRNSALSGERGEVAQGASYSHRLVRLP